MTIAMFDASVPVFKQFLNSLSALLTKAQTHVKEHHLEEESILKARLFPNMFDFTRQVQIAADFAKGVSARLAGFEVPVYSDDETNFQELQARLFKTLHFIESIPPKAFDGSENRDIITQAGTPKEKHFKGLVYLCHYGLPHFYFHTTTAYDILRHQGVEIGKKDFLGT
ncbi:MAG: DUF1993 domain-containing protein [Legionellales bacterium]|nr:DUF1993 domain-containing protein [Legionellales bacterium]